MIQITLYTFYNVSRKAVKKILDDILNFIRKMYIVKWRNMGKVSSHISCPMPCLVTSTGENRPLM